LAGRVIDPPWSARPWESKITAGIVRVNPNSPRGRSLASPHLQGRDYFCDSIVIGIDVSKDNLDVATPGGVCQYPNEPEGQWNLVDQLARWSLHSIVLEATGGYERAVVVASSRAALVRVAWEIATVIANVTGAGRDIPRTVAQPAPGRSPVAASAS